MKELNPRLVDLLREQNRMGLGVPDESPRKAPDLDRLLRRVEDQPAYWRGRAKGAEELATKARSPLERETLLRRAHEHRQREMDP